MEIQREIVEIVSESQFFRPRHSKLCETGIYNMHLYLVFFVRTKFFEVPENQ